LVPLTEENKLLAQKNQQLENDKHKLEADNKTLKDKIDRLNRRQEQVQAWLQNQENKTKGIGGGADYPPCWFRDGTGKPDYIFNVTLTSSGLLIHKNELPEHAKDAAQLPLGQITLDRQITDDTFVEQTNGVFDYSRENNCRFYVQVFDLTGSDEKDIYKRHLQAVESHFYKHMNLPGTRQIERDSANDQ
jgi:hypothetical protein